MVLLQSLAASRAAPHLRMRGTRSTLHAPLLDVKHRYHYFISHVWSTGQDQARSIKELLKESLPGVRVFLDVDDLEDISKLEEEVEASAIIIVFLSASYFASRNCMRELSHAVLNHSQVCAAPIEKHVCFPLCSMRAFCPVFNQFVLSAHPGA